MKCPYCNKKTDVTRHEMDGVPYQARTCPSCKEGFLNMRELHELGVKHKKMREAKKATFAQWGNSLAVRIPKEIVDDLHLVAGSKGRILKDKKGIKIILE